MQIYDDVKDVRREPRGLKRRVAFGSFMARLDLYLNCQIAFGGENIDQLRIAMHHGGEPAAAQQLASYEMLPHKSGLTGPDLQQG